MKDVPLDLRRDIVAELHDWSLQIEEERRRHMRLKRPHGNHIAYLARERDRIAGLGERLRRTVASSDVDYLKAIND